MARAEQAPGAEKESRPSPIDVHVGARIRLRRTLLACRRSVWVRRWD